MSRLSRFVLPGYPHHVTLRGNRRERTFFEDGDYALRFDLLHKHSPRTGLTLQTGKRGRKRKVAIGE